MLKSKDIMLRTHVSDLKGKISEQVRVEGFVQARRDQGGIKFLVVRDVTGTVQAIVTRQNGEVFDEVAKLTLESVIDLTGMIKEQKQAPGGFEIEIEALKVLSVAEPLPIPVVEEKSGGEVDAALRFDYRWLDLRKPEKLKIFKVWTALEKGFRKYFSDNGYVQVYSPSIMGTASEGGSEVFEVQYFDRKGYLAQSPQFYKQLAQSAGFEKVFMVGPVFRAEPSFTTRHMTEFTGWDFELSYIDSHEDIMQAEEAMLVEAFKTAKEEVMPELEIEDHLVVEKSYPDFWKHLGIAGFNIS